jgi:hypothetical protein
MLYNTEKSGCKFLAGQQIISELRIDQYFRSCEGIINYGTKFCISFT